jgi:hypothetical protein
MMPKGPSSRTLVVLFRVLAFATLLLSQTSWALPEFVRYGYNNCTACHYSPSGGGVLNPYGREFSANTLSMIDGGGPFLFGAVNLPSWLAMQGELSTLNLRDNDPATNTTTPTNIFMQEDLEAALVSKHFVLDATIGRQDSAPSPHSEFFSRRFYLDYKPTDQISIRAGKFLRNYGINTDDHETEVKEGLGFDQGSRITSKWPGSAKSSRFTRQRTLVGPTILASTPRRASS